MSTDRSKTRDRDFGRDDALGLLSATLILGGWLGSLWILLSIEVTWANAWVVPAGVVLQTFLYTGVFITAHDAMHGTVAPASRRLNDAVGTLAVLMYALFSYEKLHEKHWEHHDHPASQHDPDYHDGEKEGFWAWYFNFLKNYVGVWQIVGMAVVFNVLHHLVGLSLLNLNVFWVAPAILSTLQLFYFGTYLPHREPDAGYADRHRAESNDFSVLWSFLSCYHFGYHWEHHEQPGTPWWRLPEVRRARLGGAGEPGDSNEPDSE
jgi:beta-carotene ketolase (CrtW type)